MKQLLNLLFLITITSCTQNTSQQPKSTDTSTSNPVEDSLAFTLNEYKYDSVTIDITNKNFNYIITLIVGNRKQEYDLKKMNIPVKTPEVLWVNNDYACMVTWSSQAQSRNIFIPIKQSNKFVYIDKTVNATDSINNNIVYLDTVLYDKKIVVFKVESLTNRKTKTLSLKFYKKSMWPHFENIILTKNKLSIKTIEQKSIDISDLNN